jgi:diguanylate cyclase (GGDEF)-like protein
VRDAPGAAYEGRPDDTMENSATSGGVQSGAGVLRTALLQGRERSRDLLAMAADFAFETDAAGRLVFVAPDNALGWQAGCLLGQPARLLLASPDYAFDPFTASPAYRDRRTWLRRADGTPVCLRVTAAPVNGPGSIPGLIGGMRGVAWDMSEAGVQEASTFAALRRAAILDQILDQMRQEVCGPQMILTVIEGLAAASGALGVVVVDLLARLDGTVVLHQCGLDPATILPALLAQADQEETGPGPATGPDGQHLLICTTYTRHGQRIGLCLWRAADAPEWSTGDTALLSSVGAVLRLMLEHTAIQRESLLQSRSDPLTGLFNRRTFLEEAGRRIDRLDRGGLPGTLMLVDLDNFQSLNDRHGHEMGDDALCFAAVLLRNLVRPADLIARVGGEEFALWMDEFDDLTAAERAERLRLTAPDSFAAILPADAPALSASIGIACRDPMVPETLREVMTRAEQALAAAKRSGKGQWRTAPAPG